MTWAPFLFALVLGGVIAAGVYAAYVWPDPQPDPAPEPAPEPPPPSAS